MGMYTELILGCTLSKELPKGCIDALDFVINGEDKQPRYENPTGWEQKEYNERFIERTTPVEEIRAFIEEYDLRYILRGSSYYFGAPPVCRLHYDHIDQGYRISTRANCKNYKLAIERFLKYISPFVISGSGEHEIYACVQYEEDEFPTVYSIDGTYHLTGELSPKQFDV